MVTIDRAKITELVAAALKANFTATDGVALRYPREQDENADAWVRLREIRLTRQHRNRESDEPQFAELTVELECCIGEGKTNAYAMESLIQRAASALDSVTGRDAATTHHFDLETCEDPSQINYDQERKIQTAVVTFRGSCRRTSGNSVGNFLA